MVCPAFPLQNALLPSKTGYAFHNDFLAFLNNVAETPQRVEWINSRLTLSGVRAGLKLITPYPSPMEYIRKIHTKEHIDFIDGIKTGDEFSTTLGQGARTAVACVLGAVKEVCEGSAGNAFCCIRPPGHHVQNGGQLGYCCYANVVLAAKFAREKFNVGRILIIDWDYHQGNGTHGFICGDSDILFFETYYPVMYTTACDDFTETGPAHAFPDDARRINIQMPHGATNDDFVRVFESKLVPAAERFKPELILISCGFDLMKGNYSFNVTANGISRLTRIVRQIAETYSGGKLVSMLEGGYADSGDDDRFLGDGATYHGLAECAENHVKTLITGEEYPETPYFSGTPQNSIHGPLKNQYLHSDLFGGFPEDGGPWTIAISECGGRMVKKIRNRQRLPIKVREFHLPSGYYVMSLTGRRGTFHRSFRVAD
jgi:acetoin utilization deacetylase AcuC-like enzyme